MSFDEERYAREVLEPARLAHGQPPADLLVRYGLSLPLQPARVAETLPAVLGCWRRARRELKYRKLVTRLEADHARLAPAFDKAKQGDVGPLTDAVEAARSASYAKLDKIGAEIDDIAGPLKRITPELAAEIAGNHGLQVSQLAPVLDEADIAVVAADRLPLESPVAGYPRYREALRTLGCRHTADFVLDESSDPDGGAEGELTIWDTVSIVGKPERRVVASSVHTADLAWAARPHDGSRTLASTVLVALKALIEFQGPTGVAELVRYEIAEELRTRHRQGASAAALVDYASSSLGLVADDARRIVFAVRAEPQTAAAPPAPAAPAGSGSDARVAPAPLASAAPPAPAPSSRPSAGTPLSAAPPSPATPVGAPSSAPPSRTAPGTAGPISLTAPVPRSEPGSLPHPGTRSESESLPRSHREPESPPEPESVPEPGYRAAAAAAEASAVPDEFPDNFAELPVLTGSAPVAADTVPLAAHAPLPSPNHVAADRVGDEVVVRWEWPPELTEVALRWQLGDLAWRAKSISRGAYRSQGGAWLPVGELATNGDRNAPLRIELVPVAPLHGRRVHGAPVSVTVPGRVEAWYEVTRTGPPWRRELTVAVRSGQHAHLRSLMVVLRRGTVMPLHATDGEVLRQLEDVRVSPDQPLRLRLPLPVGPYWLRCFAPGDDVELRDPPVVQMRGR